MTLLLHLHKAYFSANESTVFGFCLCGLDAVREVWFRERCVWKKKGEQGRTHLGTETDPIAYFFMFVEGPEMSWYKRHKKHKKVWLYSEWITSPKSSHTVLKTKRSLYSFTCVGVITHECVVCSNKANTAKRTAPFWNVWLLGIVSLTFAEMQLLVIAQGSAGLTSEKRWGVMRAWSLCGGPFWTPLYLNQVCFVMKTAMICS